MVPTDLSPKSGGKGPSLKQLLFCMFNSFSFLAISVGVERFRIRQIGGTNGVWGILVCKLRLRDVSANSLVFYFAWPREKKIKSRKRQKTRKWTLT